MNRIYKNFKNENIKEHINVPDYKKMEFEEKLYLEKKKFPKTNFSPFYLSSNTLNCTSFFDDSSIENNSTGDSIVHSGHRMFDLHGYTMNGAEEALRKIFTSVDRSRQQIIKINVGQGSHSQDGIAKLPDVLKKVANELQLPNPIKHEKNPGYLLMILPPIISTD